jgi:5'-phosphate synthase pdxT subunit
LIGVLALQGCVEPHQKHIEAAGAVYKPVKTAAEFDAVDAFILPGGESTTMLKLIEVFDLWEPLARNFAAKPVWGICAGAILMAETVTHPQQKSFGLLPMTVQRNAYGRQAESHFTMINNYEICFIRAPVITACSKDVEILASYEGAPVWVEQGRYIASSFHAELNLAAPSPMHQHFVHLAAQHKQAAA